MLSSRKTSAKTYRIRYYHFWGLCKIIWVSGMGVNTVKVVLLFPTPMHAFLSLLSLRLPFCEMKNRLYRNVKHCSNMWTVNFLMFKLVLEKAEEPEIKLLTSAGSLKKQESSRKTSISALLTIPKSLTVWITINCGKFFKRWEY